MLSDEQFPARRATGRLHPGFIVLGLVILVVFAALGLARFGYTSILPAMQEALRLSNTQAGVLQSWNLVGYFVAALFAGVLAVHFGPRRVIVAGLLVVACGMAVSALFPAYGPACAGRFLAGAGGAAAYVPAMGLLSAWFGRSRRGMASGAGVAGSGLGLMATGPLVPVILQHWGGLGWRVSWGMLAAMTLAVCAAATLFLRNSPYELGLRPVGEEDHGTTGPRDNRTTGPRDHGTTGCPEIPAAARLPRSAGMGAVHRSVLLWRMALVYWGYGFSYIICSTFFIRHLCAGAGFSRAAAGALWFQVGVLSTASGFIWGMVSDRLGRRAALLMVFGLQGASFLLLGMCHSGWGVHLPALFFALTAWSVPALMVASCGDLFGARLAPAALGLITLVFGIGQALGPWLAGLIADASGSFAPAFVMAGIVSLAVGGGGSLTLPRGSGRTPTA